MGNEYKSFDDKFSLLQNYIKGSYSVESHSNTFSSLKLYNEKVGMAYSLLAEAKLLPERMNIHPKSAKESKFFREKGNKEFSQKQDILAIQTYSVSAAFAPLDSEELALAFANRSAVTFTFHEYESCIKDIDRALARCYPKHLRYKLYERKGRCLLFLRKYFSAKSIFKLALDSLKSSHLNEEKQKCISSSLNEQLNNCLGNDTSTEIREKCLPQLSVNKNDEILSASSLVRIEFTEELGRHLIATANIEPGIRFMIKEGDLNNLKNQEITHTEF